jgi:hypothetical protein
MKRHLGILLLVAVSLVFSSTAFSDQFNGHAEFGTDIYGYYYIISAGQFPDGQTRTGESASGGVMRYITDAPDWGYTIDQWHKDGWFAENSGFALTMKNAGAIVYDNNGIETHTTAGFYHYATNSNLAGLYCGYSMSNNWDWIYAGYFKITAPTTVDTLIGYWNNGPMQGVPPIDPNNPDLRFRMNIWSEDTGTLLPAVASFTGNIFSSDYASGVFSTSDTGEDRTLPSGATRDIYRLTYTLDSPITLQPGDYYFSHDVVIPIPGTLVLLGSGLLGLVGLRRIRKI